MIARYLSSTGPLVICVFSLNHHMNHYGKQKYKN